jgi:predicted ribosome quality control (RQC) complex YloA/Tae2 family protein
VDNFFLAAIASEIEPQVVGRVLLRVSIAGPDLWLDMGLGNRRRLRVSLDPASPGIYISARNSTENDSTSPASHSFLALLHKQLVGARLAALSKDPSDRVVRLAFEPYDPTGNIRQRSLVLALTGRTTNVFLTDGLHIVEASLRERATTSIGEKIDATSRTDLYDAYLARLKPSLTRDEVLAHFFGSGSMFGPQLEREFVIRCKGQLPSEAFSSLLTDVLKRRARPLLYASCALDEIGNSPVTIRTDLLLSHIELLQAAGLVRHEFDSLSEAADQYYSARSSAKAYLAEFVSVQQLLLGEIKRHGAAIKALELDRSRFQDPDRLRRYGDLLLANLSTGRLEGSIARVVDYYDPEQRETEIQLDEGVTIQQAAASYFGRYQKAKRGMKAVTSRLEEIKSKLDPLNSLLGELRADPTSATMARVRVSAERLLGRKGRKPGEKTKQGKQREASTGRRFLSSDGFEILVGRKDRDNDQLTFRVAQSQDLFLHAADYPGSHVIIRNPNRKPVPQQTIQEAAELAAFFSQAKSHGKAAVHYTEKKSVTKPPRAKPGLVRLSSFKTILVQPRCVLERIE